MDHEQIMVNEESKVCGGGVEANWRHLTWAARALVQAPLGGIPDILV